MLLWSRNGVRPSPDIVPAMAARASAIVTAVLLSACTASPLDPDAVKDAREHYQAAGETPQIFTFAASSMHQALEHLEQAEELLESDASQDEVDHHGFLARQHVAIAEARLRRALAQQDVDQAEERRRMLLLQARQQKAAAAAARVEAIESELADTRMQLRMAEERAKALADRLVEAGVTSSRDD